jgi:short subunit dehydrogenase-like uncharacterized protein
MASSFLIYGSYGFLGRAITRLAKQQGLQPILAGRNKEKVKQQAGELGSDYRVFALDDAREIHSGLENVELLLNCAGPYMHTYKPLVEACLHQGCHYLDLTGELNVFQGIAAFDEQAQEKDVMLLPGAGFDVVPTDCLAVHLQKRLPEATHLTLAFHFDGPANLPPGSLNTMVEMFPEDWSQVHREDGELRVAPGKRKSRLVDFGRGPTKAVMLTWGDVFTAYYSTGIPNIENYMVLGEDLVRQLRLTSILRPLFRFEFVRRLARSTMPEGSTAEERAVSYGRVWGEVMDNQGNKAVSRITGPEATVEWTSLTTLGIVRKIFNGEYKPGYQTPAMAYGADFVLENGPVVREDL